MCLHYMLDNGVQSAWFICHVTIGKQGVVTKTNCVESFSSSSDLVLHAYFYNPKDNNQSNVNPNSVSSQKVVVDIHHLFGKRTMF